MVAITASGQTRDTIEVLAEANRRGARTVCITSASQSPAARAADEVLLTAARETTFRTGAMSSRIAALTVVDILMTAVVQRHFGARVSALEATHSAVAVRRVEPQPNTDEQPAGTGGPKTIAAPVPAHERADVDSPTEEPNPRTADLDVLSTLDLLRVINDEDAIVPQAVAATLPGLATVVDEAATRVRAGGHVHYFGAGTSGRLAVLDAAELIPTFNIPEGLVVAHLAGGVAVLGRAGENVEDDESAAAHEVTASVTPGDVVIGLAASGRTPYIRGALRRARELGAFTVLVSSNPRAPLAEHADVTLIADTGPEALTGSTRLKAGTAQKLVLNTFSTALMVRLERTYGNFMVEVQPINAKLHGRVLRILRQATGAADEQCQAALARSDGELRTALLDLLWTAAGRSRTAPSDRVAACRVALARSRGDIRAALALLDHQGKGRTAGRTAP
jgi:N-acetylmuramic acid 6-phosphate etherase